MKGVLVILVSLIVLTVAAANSISAFKPWNSLGTKISHIENKLVGMDEMFSKTQELLSDYVGQANSAVSNTQVTTDETSRNGSLQIVFESVPRMILPLTTANVTLSCRLEDSPTSNNGRLVGGRGDTADIARVTSIVITKDGIDLASVTQSGVMTFAVFPDVDVTGTVSQIPEEEAFLQVVNKSPVGQLSGSYKCYVSGLDEHGHAHAINKDVKVTEKEVKITDLIEDFNEKLRTEKDQMNIVVDELLNTMDGQNDTIERMLKTIKNMNETLTKIANTHVYFFAYTKGKMTISTGTKVIYDGIRVNVGGGYNSATGDFKCPESGYYQFNMHLSSQENKYAQLFLYHNNNEMVRMEADNTDKELGWQYGSNTVVLLLNKGDIVNLKAGDHQSTTYLYGNTYTTFSGVLLALT